MPAHLCICVCVHLHICALLTSGLITQDSADNFCSITPGACPLKMSNLAEKSKYSYPSGQSVPTTIKLLVGQREKLNFFLHHSKNSFGPNPVKNVFFSVLSVLWQPQIWLDINYVTTMFGRRVEKDN